MDRTHSQARINLEPIHPSEEVRDVEEYFVYLRSALDHREGELLQLTPRLSKKADTHGDAQIIMTDGLLEKGRVWLPGG